MRPPVPVICIIGGPTAVGKSAIACAVATKLRGEIVSADSRLFFRELEIGTDKPPAVIRASIPHHFIDICSITETFSVHDFAQQAHSLVSALTASGRCPVITGGSGLYLRALARGLFDLPEDARDRIPSIRRTLEERTTEDMRQQLMRIDPETAVRLHPNDRMRIRRALEVFLATGTPLSVWQKTRQNTVGRFGRVVSLVLHRPRDILRERIRRRVHNMLAAGWVDEVKRLRDAGLSRYIREKAPIGYADILDALEGNADFQGLEERIEARTWLLARRQTAWFKRDTADWLDIKEETEETVAQHIVRLVRSAASPPPA